ncbi:MAG: sulfatase-like hydrolase/transferase [Candidatus Zixiibacteriota bacterium]|nr:MAG: sulfatase-like hydrolase/transferase [candidate division Zixibacteria bacterium]
MAGFIPLMKGESTSGHRWRVLLPPQPIIFLIGVYVVGMLFFSLLRTILLFNYPEHVEGEAVSQIIAAFLIGLRFDQIVVLVSLVPLALSLPWLTAGSIARRRLILVYLTAVFGIHFLLLLAEIRFYFFFDSRLNFLAIEYIDEGSMFGNLIISDPGFFPTLIAWLILLTVFTLVLLFVRRKVFAKPEKRDWLNRTIYFVIVLLLFALGIRGRISLAPMDWGVAYFSQNRFLNQLALNGVYTLGRNLTESSRDPRLVYLPEEKRFPLVEFETALRTTQEMLQDERNEWLDPAGSLRRITRQPQAAFGFKPNVILIMSESWTADLTGALGDIRNLTPNFDSLAKRGALFENFYACGTRTNYGVGAVHCSFPAIPGRAIMKRYNAGHPFVSLPELLDERGYFNAFIYGGDLAFDNMEGFLREKKFHAFFGDRQLGLDLYFSKWGIPDHILFEKAAALIDSFPRPFQSTVLTLSNHEPWDLPDSSVRRYFDDADSSKTFNSQIYADYALGRFFSLLENNPVFDSTIVIFVSDHARYGSSRFALDPGYFHIPFLIYARALLPHLAKRYSEFGCQTDILPTLMGLLGSDYTHASWGRDLFHLPDGDYGFAIMNLGHRIGYVDRHYLYVEELGGLNGYGATNISDLEETWFGYTTLKEMNVIGQIHSNENWLKVLSSSIDSRNLFANMHAINRIGVKGRGHLLVQTLPYRDTSLTTVPAVEPEGLVWARKRLRHYVQAADQLSTPREP